MVPAEEDFDIYLHEVDSMPINCYEEDVEQMVPRMKGAAGSSGVDAEMAKDWLLRHKVHSQALRSELSE